MYFGKPMKFSTNWVCIVVMASSIKVTEMAKKKKKKKSIRAKHNPSFFLRCVGHYCVYFCKNNLKHLNVYNLFICTISLQMCLFLFNPV